MLETREAATRYAMTVLRLAPDWQEAQHALADHAIFGPWLREHHPDSEVSACESIIREAEKRLSDELPY
jgi:hypothetical protein